MDVIDNNITILYILPRKSENVSLVYTMITEMAIKIRCSKECGMRVTYNGPLIVANTLVIWINR